MRFAIRKRPEIIATFRSWSAIAASACLSLLGLWASLHETLLLWGPDADMAAPVLLWRGVEQHGLRFLATWAYTIDNWLLSLLPLMFTTFAIAGPEPILLLGFGWIVYLGCVALTLAIAWRLAGLSACLILAPLLLLSSAPVLGPVGFLSYPVTHNISLLWGLLALLAAGFWVSGRSALWLGLALAALMIDGLSDPWATVAFAIPALATPLALACATADTVERRRLLLLAGGAAIALVLIATKLAGLLGFLPGAGFTMPGTHVIAANALWLGSTLATLFDIVPGVQTPHVIAALVTGAWLIWMAVRLSIVSVRHFATLRLEARLAIGFAFCSSAMVMLAFLLSRFPKGEYVGRMLLNVYFFGLLLIVLGLSMFWRDFGRITRLGFATFVALCLACGALSHRAAWQFAIPTVHDTGSRTLTLFLQAHGLSYGYGPYWGAQANAVTWLSGGDVIIRPVSFDPHTGTISPRHVQTSPLWYLRDEVPSDVSRFFVIVRNDGENCRDPALCVAGLQAQFGAADSVLQDGDMWVLIWPRSLLAHMRQ